MEVTQDDRCALCDSEYECVSRLEMCSLDWPNIVRITVDSGEVQACCACV